MSRALRRAPAAPAALAALADALACALGGADGEVCVSLDELQALGAPPPCEVGELVAPDRARRGHGSPLRRLTKGRVAWSYQRHPEGGGPARFLVRPWQGLGPGQLPPLTRRPPLRAPCGNPVDMAARRALIAAAFKGR